MRFTRIIGPPKGNPTRRPPGLSTPPGASAPQGPAARPDRPHVRPASYVLVSVLFSGLLFTLFLVGDRGFLTVRRQRQELARLHDEVKSLDEENKRLEAEVVALREDPRAVEKIAREDLNLVKPGEIVLVLPEGWQERVRPDGKPAATSSRSGGPETAPKK